MQVLPVILYCLGIVLLVVLIILSIKLIHTVDKTNKILDDIYNKTRSLNGLFDAIDKVTDTLCTLSDSVVGKVTSVIGKIFPKRKRKKDDDYE